MGKLEADHCTRGTPDLTALKARMDSFDSMRLGSRTASVEMPSAKNKYYCYGARK